MGKLDLLCVTTDVNATTFFGFAYAEDYNSTLLQPLYAVLVKSNAHSSFMQGLRWSVVSKFDASKLSGYPGLINGVDTSCAMNALGVFTMFGQYSSTTPFASTKLPFGIRYDPAGKMNPMVGYNGDGAWSNITVADGFTWSGPFNRYALGYTNSSANAMLVHASFSHTNDTIALATLNESTMTLAPMADWSVNGTIHGNYMQALTIGNGYIYTYSPMPLSASKGTPAFLTGFPLAVISTTIPIGTIYNTTALTEGYYITARCSASPRPIVYVNHGSLTLVCGFDFPDWLYRGTLHTIRDLSTSLIVGPGIEFDGDVVNLDYFAAVSSGSRMMDFALFRKSSSPSALSAGGISGTVVGFIVVISGVFLLIVMRCWIRRNKDSITTTTAAENVPGEDDDDISVSSEKMGYDSEPNYIEGKYSDASYAEGQTGSIDILPMAPITPIPEHMQEELRVLQERMRVLQDQIRATQFSSHPRPNVVTTVSNITASTASGAPESAPGSGNITTPGARTGSPESLPNVPSSRLSESMDLGYSSAPAYSSVINQASLQSSSEVAPQEFVQSSEAVLSPLAPSYAIDSGL
ncbi:hypothetical protein K457DRAFT_20596 [Linnemannia elongata AG-77]|uniref:Uncharacterized protein n=1 Tax=Linnemannia elongata AG-77 TaxID=1314771 RepID=A0A197JRN1_9FUNG|nr:hypothetical protein K457DRAFT_20596 [Linnemannia elongata AG-77]